MLQPNTYIKYHSLRLRYPPGTHYFFLTILGNSVCTMKSTNKSKAMAFLSGVNTGSSSPWCFMCFLFFGLTCRTGKMFGKLNTAIKSLRLPLDTDSLDKLHRSHQYDRTSCQPHTPSPAEHSWQAPSPTQSSS